MPAQVIYLDDYRRRVANEIVHDECPHPRDKRIAKPDPEDPEGAWVQTCKLCGAEVDD